MFIIDAGAFDGVVEGAAGVVLRGQKGVGARVIATGKAPAHADRPDLGRDVELQFILYLVERLERVAAFAVNLVDKGDYRDVAQAANLEQFAGLAFDAAGCIDDHNRTVDGGERAVGVFGKVFVAGGVEEVELQTAVFERHHRACDRYAAFLFNLHPVRSGTARFTTRLDVARQVDGTAGEQQLLGQRCFAGVRVGNYCERAAVGVRQRHGRRLALFCRTGKCGRYTSWRARATGVRLLADLCSGAWM